MNNQFNEVAGPIGDAASGEDGTEMSSQDSALAAVLESLLSDYRICYDRTLELPSTRDLVRYLVGALSSQAAMDCERAFLAESSSRRALRQTRQSLRELQRLTWDEVAKRAYDLGDACSEVAGAWLDLVGERVVAAPQSPRRWQVQGWSRIRQEVASGIREAQAAWSSFLAFGDQWRAIIQFQAMTPALQRGGEEKKDYVSPVPKAGVPITDIECNIDQDSTLHVIARGVPLTQESSPHDVQSTVLLSLRRDDDLWPLSTSNLMENRLEWTLPGFGAALGLPAGPLPPQFFAFDVAEESYAARASARTMRAHVIDAAGQTIAGALAYIELVSEPRVVDGQFAVEIAIPAFIRIAYPDYSLELSLFITVEYRQRLSVWPLNSWGPSPQLLTAPCPGVSDTVLAGDALLHARLLIPE